MVFVFTYLVDSTNSPPAKEGLGVVDSLLDKEGPGVVGGVRGGCIISRFTFSCSQTQNPARSTTMKTMLITPEGLEKLKAELDHLWRVERPDTTQKVSWAASLGDRSENADYHYNKKRLREIDRRILYLRKCIDNLKVVHYSPFQEGKVMFGAWVEIENTQKKLKKRLRIVGGEEIIGTTDYISMDSPMAQALLNKETGDEVVVKTPAREFVWRITKIEYQK